MNEKKPKEQNNVEQNPEASIYENKKILNKTLKQIGKCLPSCVCANCGSLVSDREKKWAKRSQFGPIYPASLTFSYLLDDDGNFVVPCVGQPSLKFPIKEKEKQGILYVSMCGLCYANLKNIGKGIDYFSDFGERPQELEVLNLKERSSIALASLYCNLKKPVGNSSYYFLKGSMSSKHQDFNGTLGMLSDPVKAIDKYDKAKVVAALNFLRKHNPLYHDFHPKIETILGYYDSTLLGGFVHDDILPTADQLNFEQKLNEPVWLMNEEEGENCNHPLNSLKNLDLGIQSPKFSSSHTSTLPYSDKFLEAKIFPTLFPNSHGGWYYHNNGISFSSYLKIRTYSIDPRWRDDQQWAFLSFDRLSKSKIHGVNNVVIGSNSNRPKNLTAKEFVNEDDYFENGRIMPNTIQGSKSYFFTKFLELKAILKVLGLPTYFITLTSNDHDEALKPFLRGRPANQCPLEVTDYFMQKFHSIKTLLTGPNSILGEVEDHWYRLEIQQRGAVHVHMIIWVKDNEKKKPIDSVVYATIPEHQSLLKTLVEKYQIHSCYPKCQSKSKGSCKYGFPFSPRSESGFDEKGAKYLPKRGPGDIRVVEYNPTLLLAWNAHCNIVPVTSISIGEYLIKYISKAEPSLAASLNLSDEQKYFQFRSVSQPEVFLYIAGYHVVQATREVIFLNTDLNSKRWRKILPHKEILKKDKKEENIFCDSYREFYLDRPDNLDHLKIVEFLSKYKICSESLIPVYAKKQNYYLEQDKKGRWIYQRQKEVF